MAAPPESFWQRRSGFGLYELLQSWWRHRISFLISVGITLFAISIYVLAYIVESQNPLISFVERLELNALDTRFRVRPSTATAPDPRIVIVDIDQRSQEVLGKWPFSRTNFAKMLDVLKEDGARVAAFDVTFDKPDQTAAPVRALLSRLESQKKAGTPVDPRLEAEVRDLAAEYDADKKFSESIRNFGPVVLGNFFLYKQELKGIDNRTLDEYADLIQWYAIANLRALSQGTGRQDLASLVKRYDRAGLLPAATVANIPELTNAITVETAATGFFNVSADADGILRRTTLAFPYGRSTNFSDWDLYGSMEVQTVRLFLRVPSDQLTANFDDRYGFDSLDIGSNFRLKTDPVSRLSINFRGPEHTFPYYSLADVVSRKVPPGTFRDKIVLVGPSAIGIGDLRTTPFGGTTYPGVEIHANVIDNMLNHGFLIRGFRQEFIDFTLILFFGIPVGICMALVPTRWMWFGLALLGPLVALDYGAFLHGQWLNFIIPALTLSSNVLLVSLYRALFEEKEKRKVRSAFAQYLSPEVIRRLLVNPQLVEPRKTDITVMFSDIRGFTTISEKLDAQDLALFLNQYLSDMTKLVFASQGTLDKYIGDAVMAFWGAPFEEPGHADKACDSALKMMERVREMQKVWESEGKPHLDIGIGLNSGVASVGNMGSVLRYGYTALGDTVNLSSRLEGLNKDYGTHIIVNETTYVASKDNGFLFRELDLIRVKGKLQPVTIYELIGRAGQPTSYGSVEEVQSRLDLFVQGRDLYRTRLWHAAQNTFQLILDRWPDDGPSRMYWKRCQEYLFDEPPTAWDGVFTMTHK